MAKGRPICWRDEKAHWYKQSSVTWQQCIEQQYQDEITIAEYQAAMDRKRQADIDQLLQSMEAIGTLHRVESGNAEAERARVRQ